MGAQMQRGAYSRVCGASTAKRPAALGYAGAGPAQRATGSPSHVRAARRQDPREGSLLLLGHFGSDADLAFSLKPVLQLRASLAPTLLVELVGAMCDPFVNGKI